MVSTRVLEASGSFTKEQKKMRISPEIVQESLKEFGSLVEFQMRRDALSGFCLWDSASMIEQSWEHFEIDRSVDEFIE